MVSPNIARRFYLREIEHVKGIRTVIVQLQIDVPNVSFNCGLPWRGGCPAAAVTDKTISCKRWLGSKYFDNTLIPNMYLLAITTLSLPSNNP